MEGSIGSTKPFAVAGSELRKRLFSQNYTYNGKLPVLGQAAATPRFSSETTLSRGIYYGQSDRMVQNVIMHETIHLSDAERGATGGALALTPLSKAHNSIYNDAIDEAIP
jgi:hypothetical protein